MLSLSMTTLRTRINGRGILIHDEADSSEEQEVEASRGKCLNLIRRGRVTQ